MSNGYEYDEGLEMLEYDEYDESFDESEARRRRPATARGRRYGPPPTSGTAPVTRSQLQAALQPISEDMRRNATAIQSVNRDVRRTTTQLRRDLQSGQQMGALLPLLTRPRSIETTAPVANIPTGTRLLVDSDGFAALLPLLLLGGLGGQPGQSGGQQDQTMLLLVLALTMSSGR